MPPSTARRAALRSVAAHTLRCQSWPTDPVPEKRVCAVVEDAVFGMVLQGNLKGKKTNTTYVGGPNSWTHTLHGHSQLLPSFLVKDSQNRDGGPLNIWEIVVKDRFRKSVLCIWVRLSSWPHYKPIWKGSKIVHLSLSPRRRQSISREAVLAINLPRHKHV